MKKSISQKSAVSNQKVERKWKSVQEEFTGKNLTRFGGSGLIRRFFKRHWIAEEIVEPVFGQIKQVRGFRQFLLRGVEKVSAEWDLICLSHNLLKLFRNNWAPAIV